MLSLASIEPLLGVVPKITKRLEENEAEVIATLQRVLSGELTMVETLTPEEEAGARAVFEWILQVGPLALWREKILPILTDKSQLLLFTQMMSRGDYADIDVGMTVTLKELFKIWVKEVPKRTLARMAVLAISYIFYDEFHYPQPQIGVYNIAGDPFQKLKWVYRYWFNQLEVAEKGSGLESFFAAQDLNKMIPTDMVNLGPYPYPPTLGHVSVSCAGDLLAVDVLTPENTPHLFDGIADFYSTADIVSANLESTVDMSKPIGRTQATGQPARMNTSEAMFDKFRNEAKINFFSTATNHAMDWGEEGVLATLDVLKKSGAYFTGTAASQAEQDDIVVIEKKGVRLAMLAFTFDLNGYEVPKGKPYMANVVRFNDESPPPNYSLIKKQVAAARAKGADWIIAYCHWGWEFEMYPHVDIMKAAEDIIECGVDTILGNHAHVSQPAQLIPRYGKQPALVVYAFGDFVSYHPESRNSKLAYSVKFNIGKVLGTTFMFGLEALPMYIVNEDLGNGRFNCQIVKFFDVLENPKGYGLTELEQSQLHHLRDKVWHGILSPLATLRPGQKMATLAQKAKDNGLPFGAKKLKSRM